MAQDTQPPAETLAECPFCGADAIWREYDPAKPDVVSGLVVNHSPECFLSWSSPVRDDQSIRAAWNKRPALTRRAGGDEESNLGDTKVSEFIAGVKRVLQNPDGDHDGWTDHGLKHAFFRWPTIVRAINIALAATPKPPAGGEAGADAADILDHYARFIRDEVKADDLERHPYLPHIEQVAADLRAALALPAPVVEGWQPIETAPYSTEVIVRAGEMTFRAELVRDGAMTTMEDPCDQWAATREGEHPPCWSGGLCWEVNDDENTSLQPDAWMHVPAALSEGRSHG